LPTVPGIGTILSLVLLYDIPPLAPFPRVQDCASSCRLGTGATAAGGTRYGTSGHTIGTAHLQGAFSEAAALCLRHNEPGQKSRARLEKQHDTGQARTSRAPQLARAVYDMRKRTTACDLGLCLRASGSRAGEPEVSLEAPRDAPEARVLEVLYGGGSERPGTPRSPLPEPGALRGPPFWLLERRRWSKAGVCCPFPEPEPHWRALYAPPALCIGRDKGTE
jgi:hypothetical protein